MKRLDRFILKAFIGPFVAILVVVIFILMLHTLWLYIDELVGKGLSLKVILEFLFWGSCITMPLSIPLATLLSSMMTVGQMAENNELMAMKASGISLGRIILPIAVVSVFIAIGAFYVSNDLVPEAYNQIYTLRDDISKTKNEIKIPAGTFYDGIDGYILRVEGQNDETGMMYGVMVYDHSSGKGNTSLTLADSAIMKMSKHKDYLTFSLYNGGNYQETNVTKYRDTTRQLQHIDFARQELIIPLHNYSFEKSDSSRFGDQIKTMSMDVLTSERDSLRKKAEGELERHYQLIRNTAPFTLRSQLDTAKRKEILPLYAGQGKWTWNTIEKESQAYNQASSKARRYSSDMANYRNDVRENYFFLRRADLEFLKRYGSALACLLLFFIGAPLGAFVGKGGLGTNAIVAILFFVLYWVIDISATKLARDGAVGAPIGAFLADAVLGGIGVFLTWKAVHDSPLFKNDAVGTWWRRIKSRFIRIFRPARIVFMGTPEFAVASLDALLQKKYKVVGVVTVPDKPSGRGLKMNESAVKKYAVEHNLPLLQPAKLKDPAFLDALSAWKADLFVVVGFRMLPEAVWSMPRLGSFNLHAALLPQYRGAAPINWAIINGEKMSGVTTFMLDKEIDTGGIILRDECRISPDETAGELHDALMERGAALVVETAEGIIQRNVETRVQRSFIQGSEVLKTAPKLTPALCHIDWNDSTRAVYNLVRGLSPYPGAFTELAREGEKTRILKIFSASVAPDGLIPADARPGSLHTDGKTYLAVATADGGLCLGSVQLEGKKRMETADFLRGFHSPEQYTTTPGTSRAEIEKSRQQ